MEIQILDDVIYSNNLLKGKFLVDSIDAHIRKVEFRNVLLCSEGLKGSLACSIFINCLFINTTFHEIGLECVVFKGCKFIDTTILNCETWGLSFIQCCGKPEIK